VLDESGLQRVSDPTSLLPPLAAPVQLARRDARCVEVIRADGTVEPEDDSSCS